MSFLDQLATLNESGVLSISSKGCTYDQFMTNMLKLETELNECVNLYNRVMNESAIMSLLEDVENLPATLEKEKLTDKIKRTWESIVDYFFEMLDTLYNFIYEQVVLQKRFIEKHKEDIMKTDIVYGKDKQDSKKPHTIYVREYEIETFKNILNPKFIDPLINDSELEKYMRDGKINSDKLYQYYKDTILGNKVNIDIDNINKKKNELINGIDDRYKDVKTRKSKIISIRKKYQNPPKNVTPEEVKEFQQKSIAQVQSLKLYNKVTIEYCKECVAILKKYIKSSNKEGGDNK